MAKTIMVTDLTFNEARLWSEVDGDGATHLYVSVGFQLVTDTGKLTCQRTIELTGARRTTVVNFFANLKSDLLALEGI